MSPLLQSSWNVANLQDRSKFVRAAWFLVVAVSLGCASVPDDIAPAANLVTPIPLDPERVATLRDGEEVAYGVKIGLLRVADIRYRIRRFESRGLPWISIDGVTKMEGLAGALANAGGTARALVSPETFLPATSVWTTAGKHPKTRAIAFADDGNSADAAMWADSWMDTSHLRGASLLDPVSAVYLLRVIHPPPFGVEVRTLLVEGTSLHLVTIRREPVPTVEPGTAPFTRMSLRSDEVDRSTGMLLGGAPKTRLFIEVEALPPYRILRMEGKIAFGTVAVALDPDATAPPSR